MRFCALQENVVCKQLTLILQGNNVSSDQCVADYKSLNGLGKRGGFSIAPAVQYCSVARERVNVLYGSPALSSSSPPASSLTSAAWFRPWETCGWWWQQAKWWWGHWCQYCSGAPAASAGGVGSAVAAGSGGSAATAGGGR